MNIGIGLEATVALTSAHTGGRLALVQHSLAPATLGPPHTHSREDELSIVIEGEVGIRVGDEEAQLGVGEVAFKPRGIAHAFWSAGRTPARLIDVICPAGAEGFFEQIAACVAAAQPDALEFQNVGAAFGLSFQQAWIADLVERYNLSPLAS